MQPASRERAPAPQTQALQSPAFAADLAEKTLLLTAPLVVSPPSNSESPLLSPALSFYGGGLGAPLSRPAPLEGATGAAMQDLQLSAAANPATTLLVPPPTPGAVEPGLADLQTLAAQGIPVATERLDLHELGLSGELLKARVAHLVAALLPGEWGNVSSNVAGQNLQIIRLSGALTNCVFRVTARGGRQLILRVYGVGVDSFVKRSRELYWLCRLSEMRLGPRLLGAFLNGRLEEFLPSVTLTPDDLRLPTTLREVAREVARLHFTVRPGAGGAARARAARARAGGATVVDGAFPLHGYDSEVWSTLKAWYGLAIRAAEELQRRVAAGQLPARVAAQLAAIDLPRIRAELNGTREWATERCRWRSDDPALAGTSFSLDHSLVVFAHNDTQYGNILRLLPNATSNLPFGGISPGSGETFETSKERVVVVDYEYAGLNYRGFEIGNHFMEWCADYHSATPHLLRWERYPSDDEQRMWLETYLETWYDQCFRAASGFATPASLLLVDDRSVRIEQDDGDSGITAADVLETPDAPDFAAVPRAPVWNDDRTPGTCAWAELPQRLRERLVGELQAEVATCGLLTHLHWALWGVVQAARSEIEFDYLGYALDRVERFRRTEVALGPTPNPNPLTPGPATPRPPPTGGAPPSP